MADPIKVLEVSTPGGLERVELRRLEKLEEYQKCEELQDLIFGPDDIVRVTTLVMITAQNNGGMVIGAFVDGHRPIGFVCAYPGLTPSGRTKQCSQLMAVHPDYRSAKIGFALKKLQRAITLAQGLELVTWTFDPLVSLNAYLNVNKLGVISSSYLLDFYGTGRDGLNGGLPSDRLLVEWWVKTPWTDERLRDQPAPLCLDGYWINEVVPRADSSLPSNRRYELERDEATLCLEIPEDIAAVKHQDMGLAHAWRQELREIFQAYLPRGYYVAYFDRVKTSDLPRCGYVLKKWTGNEQQELPSQLLCSADSPASGGVS